MAYIARGLKIGLAYHNDSSQWRWAIQASGTAPGEFEKILGTHADLSTAMDNLREAIVARLA